LILSLQRRKKYQFSFFLAKKLEGKKTEKVGKGWNSITRQKWQKISISFVATFSPTFFFSFPELTTQLFDQ
jgi:hypothetical protein